MKYDLIVFADCCVDLVFSGDDVIPEFGQKEKLVDKYELELGGSNCIFASQVAKLGLKTLVIGRVGKDIFGDFVIAQLRQAGCDVSMIRADGGISTAITLHLLSGRDRAMLTIDDSIRCIDNSDVPADFSTLARHWHIGSFYLLKNLRPLVPKLIAEFKSIPGNTVSLDPNYDPEEKWTSILPVVEQVDYFLPNETELAAINPPSLPQVVGLKEGKLGATLITPNGKFNQPLIEFGDYVDAIGAGDSFDGGFVGAKLNGLDDREALIWGSLCGSGNTRRSGGVKGQLTLTELKEIRKIV